MSSDDEARVRARLHEYGDGLMPFADVPAAGRARYRRRVRRQRLAAVLAGVLVVVGVSGLGVELARRPAHSVQFGTHATSQQTTTSASSPATSASSAIESKLAITDTSWISNDIGWALVQSMILHTTDGGSTWYSVSPAPAAVGTDVTRIRFADARHGWLFGTDSFATSDGGATWTREPGVAVVALEVAHGRAYRLVSEGDGCPGPCDYQLETATVGSGHWSRVRTPDIGSGVGAQLLYDGPRLYVATYSSAMGGTHMHLVRSVDSGATWQARPDPCTAGVDDQAVQFAAAPNGFVVALCQSTGVDYVRTSTDAAMSFGPAQTLPVMPAFTGNAVRAIAAGASSAIAVVGTDASSTRVAVSHDSGASWLTTLDEPGNTDGSIAFLGFEDATTGRVAFAGDRLWTTRDGGDTWTAEHA